jgi:hypothetical protein
MCTAEQAVRQAGGVTAEPHSCRAQKPAARPGRSRKAVRRRGAGSKEESRGCRQVVHRVSQTAAKAQVASTDRRAGGRGWVFGRHQLSPQTPTAAHQGLCTHAQHQRHAAAQEQRKLQPCPQGGGGGLGMALIPQLAGHQAVGARQCIP